MRNNYQTKQKDILLKEIRKKKEEFTIKELHEELSNIGLTTIYRFIDKLVEDKILVKRIGDNNTTYYQYLEECDKDNHFFLKCNSCGTMIHVDCDYVEELSTHIKSHHKFNLNKDHIIMSGLCEKCSKENQIC